MSLVSDITPDLDAIRGEVPGSLGMRPVTVTIRVTTYTGERVGLGTATVTDTALVTSGGYNPKVRRVSTREVAASGGLYRDGDYRVGPLTPDMGAFTIATLDPATSSSPTTIQYRVAASDTPATGGWCTKVSLEADHPLHRYLVLRANGAQP